MTPKRLSYVLLGSLILIVVAGVALTIYGADALKKKSNDIVTLKLDTLALEEQKRIALQAESDLKKYTDTKESVEKIVPKSKDQARAVAELLQIATDVNATINSITFPTSDLGAAPAPRPAATNEEDASQGSTPAATAPKTSSVSQAKQVEGLPGILGIDVTVTQIDAQGTTPGSGMSYQQMIDFLRAVERNRRTMQVKSIQIQPIRSASGTITYSLTLNLTIFVKP